eukprot:782882_1
MATNCGALFVFLLLVFIYLAIIGTGSFGAYMVFSIAIAKTKEIKNDIRYLKSFNIPGRCITTESSESGRPGAEGSTIYSSHYSFKVYNNSLCADSDTGKSTNTTYHWTDKHSKKYENGEIFECVSNENCDEIYH